MKRTLILILLVVVAITATSCKTVPTGKTRELSNGKEQVQVRLYVFNVPVLFVKWYTEEVSEWFKAVEEVKEPLRYAQYALLFVCALSSVGCWYVQNPILQKRLLRIALATGLSYLSTVVVFMTLSAALGHPWWLAAPISIGLGVGCYVFWKKQEEEDPELSQSAD